MIQIAKVTLMTDKLKIAILTAFIILIAYFILSPEKVASAKPQQATEEITVRIIHEFDAKSYVKEKFGKDSDIALAIIEAESHWDTFAENKNTNGSIDRGLFQVNSIHNEENLFDEKHNIDVAYKVFKERQKITGNGWEAWATYNNGKYKQYML